MGLYIRDDEIDALARAVQSLTGARSKAEAVKQALLHELEQVKKAEPGPDRFAAAKAIAASIGPSDPNFDMKAFTDEMWGEV
jgi:antitoxin VapB